MPWRSVKGRERDVPATPPPPPLPDWEETSAEKRQNSDVHVRKTIDASEWEASQAQDASPPAHQVLVTGFPNELLSDMMLTCLIEQSGMDEVVHSFKATPGFSSAYGEVLISLDNAYSAAWCADHFHNRQWGNSMLAAEVLSSGTWDVVPDTWQWPASYSEVPEFVPSTYYGDCDIVEPPSFSASSGKSWLEEATVEKKKVQRKVKGEIANGSDTSTRDEESESGDELLKEACSVGAYSPGQ